MKKIALIADVKGWAFDNAAHLIKESLKGICEVDIFYRKNGEILNDVCDILERVYNYDIIHFFWRKELLVLLNNDNIKKLNQKGVDVEILKTKLSTGIYDHLLIDDERFNPIFNDLCKKYVTTSKKLFDIYDKNPKIKSPYMILGDTFDEKLFYPMSKLNDDKDGSLTIGWVGNSNWSNNLLDDNGNNIDFKGLHTVLKPVIEELKNEGYQIKEYYADRNIIHIPVEKMPEYYRKIDVVVCAAIVEGTPKPVLESMGMGIPMISTDVGIVREYFGEEQRKYIIGTREVGMSDDAIRENLKKKIIELYNNRYILEKLSKENFEQSKKFNSSAYKEKYIEYFMNF